MLLPSLKHKVVELHCLSIPHVATNLHVTLHLAGKRKASNSFMNTYYLLAYSPAGSIKLPPVNLPI